jgi:hypothetical protein
VRPAEGRCGVEDVAEVPENKSDGWRGGENVMREGGWDEGRCRGGSDGQMERRGEERKRGGEEEKRRGRQRKSKRERERQSTSKK